MVESSVSIISLRLGSRSPFVFSPPWHFTQCSFISGALSFWKIASPFVIRSA